MQAIVAFFMVLLLLHSNQERLGRGEEAESLQKHTLIIYVRMKNVYVCVRGYTRG